MNKGKLDRPPEGIPLKKGLILSGAVNLMPPNDGGTYTIRYCPSDQSLKRCRVHGALQKIETRIIGPMNLIDCISIGARDPRNSHWKVWTWLPYGKHFISPIDGEWFVVIVRAQCPLCPAPEIKKYRRLYGRIGRSVNQWRAHHFSESYALIPFDPRKKLEDQLFF